jgi:hypothetical protein
MSRKHRPIGSLGLALAGLALALLLGEGLLRLLGQSYYWALAKRPDPVLGWRPPPHVAAWQRFEGEALVATNALGFRDGDHVPDKPPGTLRIAVLGDSFTEAVQVPLGETWWRVMAAHLEGPGCDAGSEAEVLSFGVSGYSTAQSLLAWRAHARRFAPDVVLLAFFIGNDLTENLPALDTEPLRPYLLPGVAATGGTRGGALTLDDGFLRGGAYRAATSPVGRARQWLLERSRIAQLAMQARDAARLRGFAAPAQGTAVAAPAADVAEPREPGVDNAVYREPGTDAWRRAWQTTEALLAAFAAETRQARAEPVLMLIGTGVQVHPDAAATARFAAAIGVPDLGYPVRRLLAAAERNRIAVLNLPALMAMHAEREGILLHGFPGGLPGFGHWNGTGHALAGAAAGRLVCDLLRREAQPRASGPGSGGAAGAD